MNASKLCVQLSVEAFSCCLVLVKVGGEDLKPISRISLGPMGVGRRLELGKPTYYGTTSDE